MIVTLKAIYVNDKSQQGEPYRDKKGNQIWLVVLDTDQGKMSKLFDNEDMIPKWKKGDQVNVEIKTNGNFINWDFPKPGKGETPYSIQPENTSAPEEPIAGVASYARKRDPIEPKASYKPREDKTDWDAIAEGKVRHGVAIAFIERGIPLTEDTKTQISHWTSFIMHGK